MSGAVFVDTSYFLALVNRRDKFHAAALLASSAVPPPYVTSEAVLTEVGNALARPPARAVGIRVLREIRNDPDVTIVTIDRELFDAAVALYESRPDQSWGLTDCTSFVIMRRHDLRAALTMDRHFEQAGFERRMNGDG